MPLTVGVSIEIFTNPDDLHIVIGQERAGGKYGVMFCRGPGHDFKIMLDSRPFFKEPADAIEFIKATLQAVCKVCKKELHNTEGLNDNMISWIVSELKEKQEANTFERNNHANANRKSGRTVSKSRHAS